MSDNREDIPYSDQDRVFPSATDDDLWISVFTRLQREYPERVLMEHVRQSFEAVCKDTDDYLLFKDFMRKVRLHWLWKRPPAPRGMLNLE